MSKLALASSLITLIFTVSVLSAAERRGFEMTGIQKGSVQEKAGLKNGDVVRKVNGTKVVIDSPRQALELYNKFSETGTELEILRNGKVVKLTVP